MVRCWWISAWHNKTERSGGFQASGRDETKKEKREGASGEV